MGGVLRGNSISFMKAPQKNIRLQTSDSCILDFNLDNTAPYDQFNDNKECESA